jgi:hypothetical protein
VPSWEPPQTILLRYTAKSCPFGVSAVSHFGRWGGAALGHLFFGFSSCLRGEQLHWGMSTTSTSLPHCGNSLFIQAFVDRFPASGYLDQLPQPSRGPDSSG